MNDIVPAAQHSSALISATTFTAQFFYQLFKSKNTN